MLVLGSTSVLVRVERWVMIDTTLDSSNTGFASRFFMWWMFQWKRISINGFRVLLDLLKTKSHHHCLLMASWSQQESSPIHRISVTRFWRLSPAKQRSNLGATAMVGQGRWKLSESKTGGVLTLVRVRGFYKERCGVYKFCSNCFFIRTFWSNIS